MGLMVWFGRVLVWLHLARDSYLAPRAKVRIWSRDILRLLGSIRIWLSSSRDMSTLGAAAGWGRADAGAGPAGRCSDGVRLIEALGRR